MQPYMGLCSHQSTMMMMTMTSKREPAILITPLAVVMQNLPIACNWNAFFINKQLSKADEHTNQRTEVIASDSLHQAYWIYRKRTLAFHIVHGQWRTKMGFTGANNYPLEMNSMTFFYGIFRVFFSYSKFFWNTPQNFCLGTPLHLDTDI